MDNDNKDNKKPGFLPRNSNNFMLALMINAVAMQLIVGLVIAVVVQTNPDFGGIPFWAIIVVSQVLIFGIPCAIYLVIHRKNIRELLPLRPLGLANFIMIVAMSLMIQPLFMLINALSQLLFPNVIADILVGLTAEGGFLFALAIVAVLPSVFEEVAFRGIAFAGYKNIKIGRAALINGLLFGMIHLNMNQFLYTFFLGVVFCFFMHYTKSLWAPILAHFVVNGVQVSALFALSNADPAFTEAAAGAGDIPTITVMAAMGAVAIVTTGVFIAIYIPFKHHNLRRNEAAGIVTHAAATAEGAPQKVLTPAVWAAVLIFVAMMLIMQLATRGLPS